MRQETNLARQLIAFSIPLVLSGLLQQLFNWADAFIVGNIVGEGALAAVGATFYISNLLIMLITGFTSGVSILSARMFGQGNTGEQKHVLVTFLVVMVSLLTGLSLAGGQLVESILIWMDTPADIFHMAQTYVTIILVGMPFLAIYNVYAAVLRGIGDSRTPFLAVMVSVSANVVLDLLLVWVIPLGVAGAAWATVFSQAMMALFLMGYSGRAHSILRFAPERALFDLHILKEGCALALPITIQSTVTALGSLALQGIMNSFGTQTVAAITTAYRVDSVILLPLINLGTGVATLTAQNIGAGDRKRARRCLVVGSGVMGVTAVCLTAVVLMFGATLISLFGVSEEAVDIGRLFFRSIAWFYLPYGCAMAARGYLEGVGDVLYSGLTGIAALGVRIFLSHRLEPVFDNMVIAYAEAFGWCFMLGMFWLRAGCRFWKERME